MRIGKFAEVNELSIDTIRHYMDKGLIIPEKRNGQYCFDKSCQNDLKEILNLKSLGFTLNEAKTVLTYRRFGKLTPYQNEEHYSNIFAAKVSSITNQINELIDIKNNLEKKIQELTRNESKKQCIMGVHIKALDLLKCVRCDGDLMLSEGTIHYNQIINGKLSCICGETYSIEAGILKIGDESENSEMSFRSDFISDYINETDAAYLDNIYKSLEWGIKRLGTNELLNKVLLELGSGSGFFLRSIYNQLPENCLYIAVDHDIERHKFLKTMLQMAQCKRNILFICSDFLKVPIKDQTVDILLDLSGTSNYSFDHENFLLGLINKPIKEDALLLGSYILFKNFDVNTLIKEKYRKNFQIENIKRNIQSLQYKWMDEFTSDYINRGGKYEDYFIKGEEVYSYMFYGKR